MDLIWKQSGKPTNYFIVILAAYFFCGCSSVEVKNNTNYIPASVYRNSLQKVSANLSTRSDIQNSIFRIDFLDLLIAINREEGALNIERLRSAVMVWNAVASGFKERIKFVPEHYYIMASLDDNNTTECDQQTNCTISLRDIIVLHKWINFNVHHINAINNPAQINSLTEKINLETNRNLSKVLRAILHDPLGYKLVANALNQNTSIEIRELSGKHGFYNHTENKIVIDPKVINYEFNMRYLVHELVHVMNKQSDNSVDEEVLAELIGLEIQNHITDIPFEQHPYSTFVEHLLDPDYGRLPISNNINKIMARAGIEI